jgi:pantoate--beta-alanine ligase
MEIIEESQCMQERALRWKREGKTVVLVPTMGALHEGHLDLLREGRRSGDVLVMSLFVNPLQFGPKEDLQAYPRDLEGDREKAASCGVDVLFAPRSGDLYPEGFQTHVEVERATQGLCGAHRPGHFRGVTTVVALLLHVVLPDWAIFGQKDYQQLAAIRRMVADLRFPVRIVGMPTTRDADGLALSSRNQYLNPEQRRVAPCLFRALEAGRLAAQEGERDAAGIVSRAMALISAEPSFRVEYLELRDAATLEPVDLLERDGVLLVAAWIGKTRLIDNVVIPVS